MTKNHPGKTDVLKVIGASLLAQAITQLITVVIFNLSYQNQVEQNSYLPNMGAGIIAAYVFVPAMLVTSALCLKIFRFRNWLRLGLIAGVGSTLSYNLLSQSYSDSRYQYLIIIPAVCSIIIFVLTLYLNGQIKKHFTSYRAELLLGFIVIAISFGISYTSNTLLTDYQLNKDHLASMRSVNSGLNKIDFKIYMPHWLPDSLAIKTIQVPHPTSDAIFHSPTRLELDTGPEGRGLYFNEFIPSKDYNPPTDCGPFAAGTVSVGPAGYTVSCPKMVIVGNIPVYMNNSGSANDPPEYDYYLVKGGTEITVEDAIGHAMTTNDIIQLVNNLYETTPANLPTSQLQQQF